MKDLGRLVSLVSEVVSVTAKTLHTFFQRCHSVTDLKMGIHAYLPQLCVKIILCCTLLPSERTNFLNACFDGILESAKNVDAAFLPETFSFKIFDTSLRIQM